MNRFSRLAALMFMAALCATSAALATEFNPVAKSPRISSNDASLGVIVKLRAVTSGATQKLSSAQDRGTALSKRTGAAVEFRHEISGTMMSMSLASSGQSTSEVLERLRADPEVEYAVPDQRRYPHATTPDDPLFAGQWYLKSTEASAINAIDA